MRHRVLDEALRSYRIGDASGDYPVFSGEGAKRDPGRWNDVGQDLIYTSQAYSTALLEKLVRMNVLPPNQHFVEVTISAGTSYEEVNEAAVPGWYEENCARARAFGAKWFDERRSCILIVPSVIARVDMNILINPHHQDFQNVNPSREKPIWWDDRLFGKT